MYYTDFYVLLQGTELLSILSSVEQEHRMAHQIETMDAL